MGRKRVYPLVRIGVCHRCRRICAEYVACFQDSRYNVYCSPTCKKNYRIPLYKKDDKIVTEGRRNPETIKSPTSFENQLWK